jgi:hypothetical protein
MFGTLRRRGGCRDRAARQQEGERDGWRVTPDRLLSYGATVVVVLAGWLVLVPPASPQQVTDSCLYGLYSYGASFPSEGGEGVTRVWASAPDCPWSASSNDPAWLTVSGGASGIGTGTVSYSVNPNGGPARNGTLSIAGYLFSVRQDGVVCSYDLTASQVDVVATAGTGSVGVTANGFACAWTAVSGSPDWLQVTSGASGAGNGTVSFSYGANSGEARTGTLTVAGKSFAVHQAAPPCSFDLDSGSAAVPSTGGSGQVAVTTNLASCAWQASSSAPDWLHVTSGASGAGDGTVAWAALANPGEARAATLAIGDQTFTVDQDVAPCALTVGPAHFSVQSGGADRVVTVTANVAACAWTAVSNDPDWLAVSVPEGQGCGAVTVSAAAGTSARSGTIEIAGQIVSVSQVEDPFALVIPAAANTSGVGTSRWQTDLDMLNIGASDALVELSLLRANQANPTPETEQVTVPAGGTTRVTNVLGSLFSAGNAALGVRFLGGSADVNARFYNTASACGGTYGMMVPASQASAAVFDGSPVYFHLLTHSADPAVGFRVNVGFANGTAATADMEVELRAGNGSLLKTVTQSLEGFEHRQITTIFRQPPATSSVAAGYAVVRATTPGSMVYTYAMTIDNVSGDPIFVRPVRCTPAPVEGGLDVAISATAHTPGENGTQWQSDLDLFNAGTSPASVRLSLLRANQANPSPATADVAVAPGTTLRLDDLLGSTFSAGNAAIGVTMLSGWVDVSSRFYNTASACGGTYGMFIPGESDALAVAAGQTGYFHHLTFSRDGTKGYRVNVGFMNDTALSTDVEIRLYGDQGELLKIVTTTLLPYEHRQFTRIHRDPAPVTSDVAHGSATVTVATPGGRVHTYAMLIDNVSGDPVYIEPLVVGTAAAPQ